MRKLSGVATLLTLGTVSVAPLSALAQSGINVNAITPYSNGIIGVINTILVPVLMAIAFIVFLWGVYKYFIYGAADEKSRADGRRFVLWGIIGFVLILSLWGIVGIFMGTLGLSTGQAPPYPTIDGSTTNNGGSSAQTNCQQAGGVYNPTNGTCTGAP